jgi:hypothetical protein
VSTVDAQLIEGPPGAVGGVFGGRRPVDPNRNSQSFEATVDFSGGYDRDPNGLVLDPTLDNRDLTSWYASTGSAGAHYRAGSLRRSIEARGRGYFNYQSNIADSIFGGEGGVSALTRLGRRRLNQLSLEFQSAYEPGWVLGAFGPSLGPGPDDPSIGVAPPQGVLEQRWLGLSASAGYEHHWNLRHVTTVRYDNRRVRQVEGDGPDGDWQNVLVDQSWRARAGLDVVGGYRLDETVQRDQSGETPPIRYQTLDAGLRFEKRVSSTRRYSVTFRGGATRLITAPGATPVDSLQPALTLSAQFATSRFWSLSADVTRGVMVLAGLSPVPVLNDNLNLSLNGTPTRRLRYAIAGSLARASTVTTDPFLQNVTDVAGTTAEFRYGISSWAAAFASYAFYHHRIDDPSLVASGFPPRYDRHSVRVGVSLWVPLYGAF